MTSSVLADGLSFSQDAGVCAPYVPVMTEILGCQVRNDVMITTSRPRPRLDANSFEGQQTATETATRAGTAQRTCSKPCERRPFLHDDIPCVFPPGHLLYVPPTILRQLFFFFFKSNRHRHPDPSSKAYSARFLQYPWAWRAQR
jgi:hypothetical protein